MKNETCAIKWAMTVHWESHSVIVSGIEVLSSTPDLVKQEDEPQLLRPYFSRSGERSLELKIYIVKKQN